MYRFFRGSLIKVGFEYSFYVNMFHIRDISNTFKIIGYLNDYFKCNRSSKKWKSITQSIMSEFTKDDLFYCSFDFNKKPELVTISEDVLKSNEDDMRQYFIEMITNTLFITENEFEFFDNGEKTRILKTIKKIANAIKCDVLVKRIEVFEKYTSEEINLF